MIYPSQQSDYFPKCWNNYEFDHQFNIFIQNEGYISASEEGFTHLSLMGKILQTAKGFFGGTNLSQNERVQAAWMKFIYYGKANDFLKSNQIDQLKSKLSQNRVNPSDQNIASFFKIITTQSQKKETPQKALDQLREQIQYYHNRYASSLRPGLWSRLTTSPLPKSTLHCFGDTPLQLSKKAINQQPPDLLQGWFYLKQAFALKNNSSHFQEKLEKQLAILEKLDIKNVKKNEIQSLWIELGAVAFENNLPELAEKHLAHALENEKNRVVRNKIGEIYLINEKYSLVFPFLPDLENLYSTNVKWLHSIGIAYWKMEKYEEAVKVFQKALSHSSCYKGENKIIADLYHHLGIAHLEKKIANPVLKNAIENFSKAVKSAPCISKPSYRIDLLKGYVEQWEVSKETFCSQYADQWLDLLWGLGESVSTQNQKTILEISLGCSSWYFDQSQNDRAISYLGKMLHDFKNDVSVKIAVLDATARRLPAGMFHSCFPSWLKQHETNLCLFAKIGHAYLRKNDIVNSSKAFIKGLNLLEQRKGNEPQSDLEINASIHEGLGQIASTKKQFNGAIEHFKSAAKINPTNYSKCVSEECLKAAEHEKTVLYLLTTKKNTKITSFYQTAFEYHPENAPYLIDWMNLYLSAKMNQEAMNLINTIQKQPWAKDVHFKAEDLFTLGQLFLKNSHPHTALKCYRKAFEAEPKNFKYKKNYYEFALQLTEKQFQKIQEIEKNPSIIKTEKNKRVTASLEKLSHSLKNISSLDFKDLPNLESSFIEKRAVIYSFLAKIYFNQCLLKTPKRLIKDNILKTHFNKHKECIRKAFLNIHEAIQLQPNNAKWHFEKGMMLDFFQEYKKTTIENGALLDFLGMHEGAMKEFELAIENLPKEHSNPYYHYILGTYYYCNSRELDGKKHFNLAKEAAEALDVKILYTKKDSKELKKYDQFLNDYRNWYNEFDCSIKTQSIDPHQFTVKKGWF